MSTVRHRCVGPHPCLVLLPLLAVLALWACGGREDGRSRPEEVPLPDSASTGPTASAPSPAEEEGAVETGAAGAAVVPEAPLEGTAWRLVALPGAPDPPPGTHATLVLEPDGGMAHGSTGCVGFDGFWQIAGTRLTLGLGQLAAGRCRTELQRLQTDYVEALRRAGSYRLRGDTLELLGARGVVARFVAP